MRPWDVSDEGSAVEGCVSEGSEMDPEREIDVSALEGGTVKICVLVRAGGARELRGLRLIQSIRSLAWRP